ncbi:MAG TPA: hypothetical protein VH437_11705 [Terriglobales bacterium]|jgi:hypothetical protein
MPSVIKPETLYLHQQKPRRTLLWYAVVLILASLIIATIICLLVSAWRQPTNISYLEKSSPTVANYPMQVSPLFAGNNKAKIGELVYLTHVLLKPGPTQRIFFLAGSKGSKILTAVEGAHLAATPGDTVDVRGTIRGTPSVTILRKRWKLSLVDAKRVSQMSIYIDSEFIKESRD